MRHRLTTARDHSSQVRFPAGRAGHPPRTLLPQIVAAFCWLCFGGLAGLFASPPGSVAASMSPSGIWHPALTTSWDWQLQPPLNLAVDVQMLDIDLFDTEASVVASLHQAGRKVVCYISVGSWEDWRPDAAQFPVAVLGNDYEGWEGEKWLDIRQIELLAPIMRARLDLCQAKGFDAVEPDNIDGYTNDTGFPLTYADQLAYNTWLAHEAHARGLSIGLKNDPDQVTDLLALYDWALTEDCFADGWCDQLTLFVQAGKAVFMAEYTDSGVTLDAVCAEAHALGFNALMKRRALDAWRQSCPTVATATPTSTPTATPTATTRIPRVYLPLVRR